MFYPFGALYILTERGSMTTPLHYTTTATAGGTIQTGTQHWRIHISRRTTILAFMAFKQVIMWLLN